MDGGVTAANGSYQRDMGLNILEKQNRNDVPDFSNNPTHYNKQLTNTTSPTHPSALKAQLPPRHIKNNSSYDSFTHRTHRLKPLNNPS